MKLIILAALISACAAASFTEQNGFAQGIRYSPQYFENRDRPQARARDRNANTLRAESEVNEQGFHYAYDTDNGIHADETGYESNGIQAAGSYSYTGDDGQVYSVTYTADSNGFQPKGAHLPTPPPIPEAIARSLQENARDEAAGVFDDGSYHDNKYAPGVIIARNQYQPTRYSPYRPYRRY